MILIDHIFQNTCSLTTGRSAGMDQAPAAAEPHGASRVYHRQWPRGPGGGAAAEPRRAPGGGAGEALR